MNLKNWNDIKKRKLDEGEILEAEEWARNESLLIDLRQLREWAALTQNELADKMELSQAELSRSERRADHLVSTLRRYIEALGGELEIRAIINDRSIRLKL